MDVPRRKETNAAQTCIRVSISITPVRSGGQDVPELLGNLFFDFLQVAGFSGQVCSKIHAQIIDSVSEVIEHCVLFGEALRLDLVAQGDKVTMDISSPAVQHGRGVVAIRLRQVARSEDPRTLLGEVVRERHVDRAKGGLGLTRHTGESKRRLGVGEEGTGASSRPALRLVRSLKVPD